MCSQNEIKQIKNELHGMDWKNNDLFFTYEWEDETSQFDEHPSKRFINDYYYRTYKARIPIAFQNCETLIHRFIETMLDYPDETGFWVQ